MEQLVNEIRLGYADGVVNERLAAPSASSTAPYGLRYNQSEELFLELAEPFDVPRFPIHHDVRQDEPSPVYLASIRTWIGSLLSVVPPFFSDLTYFFDPAETLKPCFFKVYKIAEEYYLYLLRVDLAFRPLEAEMLERGGNDETAAYRSRRLYVESDIIPLAANPGQTDRGVAFAVRQVVSQTWVGETGKGYFVRGIWMDSELTKFFSKLFLVPGKRSYPFYPFTCKYRTICMTVPDPAPERRRALLPYLRAAIEFLSPEMERIQEDLKGIDFAETLPIFADLRSRVEGRLREPWTEVTVTPYLNENEQKEFRVEF